MEFIKNRVDDGMEIFPCLEIVTDAIKAGIAFIIGLLDWLWNHHMWGTLGEHVTIAKESLEDGIHNAREISAPYIETGWEMTVFLWGKD